MARPIALIHCALSHGGQWRDFLSALNMDDVEPILVELPGHGKAEDWDRSRDFSDQALEILLDELPREAVPVIGHSFGAVVALRAAVERPGRVSSLVVIEPPFYAALEGNYMQQTVFSEMAA
ncbi:MAG: alpha/beta hydrolase, partial [Pseudomonadota bacterium]